VRIALPVLLLLAAGPLKAQEWITVPEDQRGAEPSPEALSEFQSDDQPEPQPDLPPEAPQVTAVSAPGGVLRVLDKINGTLTDLDLRNGETREVGPLTITMDDCRAPSDNPSGDAFALVSIRSTQDQAPVFEGWLIASAPALNAMDHPRYDVWALRCLGA
jgi:hypothetical protein